MYAKGFRDIAREVGKGLGLSKGDVVACVGEGGHCGVNFGLRDSIDGGAFEEVVEECCQYYCAVSKLDLVAFLCYSTWEFILMEEEERSWSHSQRKPTWRTLLSLKHQ